MPSNVILRDVLDEDVAIFFEHQCDSEAIRMAAFTAKDPTDRTAFDAHWQRLRRDSNVTPKTILWQEQVAGHVVSFEQLGEREVSYWVGRKFWGKGVASNALQEFLKIEVVRPLHARVAKDNAASLRVLQKCGFSVNGEDQAFANGRGGEVAEFLLALDT